MRREITARRFHTTCQEDMAGEPTFLPRLPNLQRVADLELEPQRQRVLPSSSSTPSIRWKAARARISLSVDETASATDVSEGDSLRHKRRFADVAAAAMMIDKSPASEDNVIIVSRVTAVNKWPTLSPRSAVLKEETIQRLASWPDASLWRSIVQANVEEIRLDHPSPSKSRVPAAEPTYASPVGVRRPRQRGRSHVPGHRARLAASVVAESEAAQEQQFDARLQDDTVASASIEPVATSPDRQPDDGEDLEATEMTQAPRPIVPKLNTSTKAAAARAAEEAVVQASSKASRRHAEAIAAVRQARENRLLSAYGSLAVAGLARAREPRHHVLPSSLTSSASAPISVKRTLGGSILNSINYRLVEKTSSVVSFGKLPRIDEVRQHHPADQETKRRPDRKSSHSPAKPWQSPMRRSDPHVVPRTRRRDVLILDSAPLSNAYEAAAVAAVLAVAEEQAAAMEAKLEARRLAAALASKTTEDAVDDGQHKESLAKAPSRRQSTDELLKGNNQLAISTAAAARKWPDLSPRSAVRKEQMIQQLAKLPPGAAFGYSVMPGLDVEVRDLLR